MVALQREKRENSSSANIGKSRIENKTLAFNSSKHSVNFATNYVASAIDNKFRRNFRFASTSRPKFNKNTDPRNVSYQIYSFTVPNVLRLVCSSLFAWTRRQRLLLKREITIIKHGIYDVSKPNTTRLWSDEKNTGVQYLRPTKTIQVILINEFNLTDKATCIQSRYNTNSSVFGDDLKIHNELQLLFIFSNVRASSKRDYCQYNLKHSIILQD